MGVHGLWKLIDAAGKPVPVETLENRILAIDVSIWLHQLVKGFQDSTGSSGANAHLLGLFYRICKLLFFRIKPVFVFDGGVPALKRKTIAARQNNRSKANESIEKIRQELLQNLLKQHALGKILGQNVKIPKSVSSKQDTLFHLPPMPSTSNKDANVEGAEVALKEDSEKSWSSADEESEESSDENSPRKKYGDIHSIDVKSHEFKALPADIRHDILSELKETRKQNSWAKVHLMPEEIGDFSSFQMNRLLKRRSVQVGLEEAEKEMGPRCFTVSEIQEILEYQGVDVTKQSQRIASDSTARILYSTQKSPEKKKDIKSVVGVIEELNSDIDDPMIDALKSNEDMSQEEILKLIREETTKRKAKKLISDCGKSSENTNEPSLDEISNTEQSDLDHGKIHSQSSSAITIKKQVTFDNKQVSSLLRDSAKKNLLPISKVAKVLEGKKRKNLKKKIIRKVSEKGPNLSESDSSESDVPLKKSKLSSDESSQEENSSSKINRKQTPPIDFDKKLMSNNEINKNEQQFSDHLPPKNISDNTDKNNPIQQISSNSSDSDLEEVTPNNTNDSSNDNLINISSSNKTKIDSGNKENNTKDRKTVSIELNFENLPSDEEDIFADVFESKKPTTPLSTKISNSITESELKVINISKNVNNEIIADSNNESKVDNIEDSDSSLESVISDNENINVDLNVSNSKLEEAILAEVIEKSKIEYAKSQNISNIMKSNDKEEVKDNLSDFIDPKEAERAVILEELLMTKNKLEKELDTGETDAEPADIKSALARYDEKFADEESQEEELCETQESLEEKKYFNDENPSAESIKKKDEISPDSFAKKLASVEQVRQFQSTLERESSSLIKEKRRDEKIAASLSEQITVDAQELLRLFGIPYIVAPMEAEAQCAFLDIHGLTEGTITDDSDIWLFGANNVYKNFFDQKKFVKLFKSTDIRKVYNLGRDELIMLGLLVGSDYTSGLNGVGPVTALEIVANFPLDDEDIFPPRDRLGRFASAFKNHKLSRKLTKKLMPVQLIEGFPSLEVVRAYTDPQVDENKDTFSWGSPDIERIQEYAMNKFGWDENKTVKTLDPIVEKLKQHKTQMTLHGFFDWAFDDVQGKMSKRVESAVSLLGTSPSKRTQEDEDASLDESPKEKAKRVLTDEKTGKKRKPRVVRNLDDGASTSSATQEQNSEESASQASTSQASSSQVPDDFSIPSFMNMPGSSTMDPFTPNIPSEPKSKKKKNDTNLIPTLPRVNATIQKLRKGKSLSDKPRLRKAREFVSLTKPLNELDFDAPFGTGETRKRKKVVRTDEEKWKEIEEARAKAARVLAKLKNVEQFHSNI